MSATTTATAARPNYAATVELLEGLTGRMLAGRADCGTPDADDSPGAGVLASVRNTILEAYADAVNDLDADDYTAPDAETLDGTIHEAADGAPSVYTHTAWSEFVDLAAYQEDLDELGPIHGDNLVQSVAMTAVYMIGRRLAEALVEELREALQEDLDNEAADAAEAEDGEE